MISIMESLKESSAACVRELLLLIMPEVYLPFNISHASFIIRNTYNNYPKGSVHIICVHSEAHKDQDHLIVKARDHFFIGTDNGIFNLILNSEPDEVVKIDHNGISDELEIFAKAASDLIIREKTFRTWKICKNYQRKSPSESNN